MKKFILILLLIIGASNLTIAQDSISVTGSKTEQLIDKYSAKIEASIVSIAQSLKQPAEHVYKVLIKQQVVKAWSYTFVIIFIFLIFIATCIPMFIYEDYRTELWGIPVVIFIVLILVWLFCSSTIIGGFINPEYNAIKDIVRLIK